TPGLPPGAATLPGVPAPSLAPPVPLTGNGLPIGAHPGVYPSYALPSYSLADQFVEAGRAPRFLVSAEFLLWWTKGFSTPPLVPGEFTEQVTAANSTAGGVRADSRSRFWGGDTNYRDNLCCWNDCTGGFRADLLAGFRYLNLKEDLTITEAYTRVAPLTV